MPCCVTDTPALTVSKSAWPVAALTRTIAKAVTSDFFCIYYFLKKYSMKHFISH